MAREIKITKGDSEGYCMPSALSTWERHGWTRADDGSSEEPEETAPEEKAPEEKAPVKKTASTRKAD